MYFSNFKRMKTNKLFISLLATLFITVGMVLPVNATSSSQKIPADLDPAHLYFQEIASGLSQPLFITNAGDGSGRLFIVERSGQILIYKNGSILPTPFLDIQSIVKSSGSEQGLLALAFHPSFGTNHEFYVAYTAERNGDSTGSNLVLEKFLVSANNADQANASSGSILLSISHPNYPNHNGGTLAFGSNGYLYWSTGDGGSGGDPDNNAQNLNSLLGKILRIDVDSASPYSIPTTNPFYNNPSPSIRKEIWAYGLRNPWRLSFDRMTADLYIGDVGQSRQEEIDFQPAGSSGGENYGWRVMEGSLCYNPSSGCDQTNKVLPITEYDHSLGCSVTGGYVYRGQAYPELNGYYFYGDFCSGRLFRAYHNGNGWVSSQILDTTFSISSFGEDENGELYIVDYSSGKIYQMQYILPPPNDDINFASAVNSIPFTSTLGTSGATQAGDDPSVPGCNLKAGIASVWYRYVPSSNQPVYIDTFNSSYDTYIAVWTGPRGNLSPVTCNDDTNGIQSAAGFNAVAQTTYFIEIAQYNGTLSGAVSKSIPSSTGGSLKLHLTSFSDVPGTHIFWRPIEGFYKAGITVGCSQSPKMYCPNQPVTRAEMAVFLLRAMFGSSYQPNPAQKGMFADVPYPGLEPFTPWIEQFYLEGVTAGCSQNPLRYCPNQPVTRAEMTIFIELALHGRNYQPHPSQTGMFADVPYPGLESFTPWIEQFYLDGITAGCSLNPLMYCPQNLVTRGEMAVFIDRAFSIPIP